MVGRSVGDMYVGIGTGCVVVGSVWSSVCIWQVEVQEVPLHKNRDRIYKGNHDAYRQGSDWPVLSLPQLALASHCFPRCPTK